MKLPKQSANASWKYYTDSIRDIDLATTKSGIKPSSAGGGGGGNPPPGCYPAGTECRVGLQNMVYCCPGGTTWKRQEGWCVGWWDAMPCRPLG